MTIHPQAIQPRVHRAAGFTLIEVLVAAAVVGIVLISIYGGISTGMRIVQASQEELAATQICAEKLELLRLYSWDQVTVPGFIPTGFKECMYPSSATNRTTALNGNPAGDGVVYYGTVAITTPNSFPAAYTNSLRLVTITLNWTNGTLPRTHSVSTYFSRYGIADFVN